MDFDNSRKTSVIVPVINEEDNILPLIERVREALGQTDWELVIVDDGSTDFHPVVEACSPVQMAVREGAQYTPGACALVNVIPESAKRSILGVLTCL